MSNSASLRSNPTEAVKRRVAGSDESHARGRHPHAAQLVAVLDGLERDVVAEPLGLLMGVGVAADVAEQGRVVHRRSGRLVDAGLLGQPQSDQALSKDVLHRLVEPEVDPQRQGGDELRVDH